MPEPFANPILLYVMSGNWLEFTRVGSRERIEERTPREQNRSGERR